MKKFVKKFTFRKGEKGSVSLSIINETHLQRLNRMLRKRIYREVTPVQIACNEDETLLVRDNHDNYHSIPLADYPVCDVVLGRTKERTFASIIRERNIDRETWGIYEYDPKEITHLDFLYADFATITNGKNLFDGMKNINELDLYWLILSLTTAAYMFSYCMNLKRISWHETSAHFDAVEDFTGMFYHCCLLENIPQGLVTTNAISTARMFCYCESLVNISDIKLVHIKDMSLMFCGCHNLVSLSEIEWDLGELDPPEEPLQDNCKNGILAAFSECSKLTDITGTIRNLKVSVDLGDCPLTNESAMVFINGVVDVTEPQSLTFSSQTYDTLTEEQIATATSKGWTVIKRLNL